MPTGYTYPVENGDVTELNEFVWSCARSCGCFSAMRDEPSAPIPLSGFYDSEHEHENLLDAKRRLANLQSLSASEWDAELDTEVRVAERSIEQCNAKYLKYNKRYDAMLEKVNNWNPPTPEHDTLKNYMVSQLQMSRYAHHLSAPVRRTKKDALDYAERNVERAAEYLATSQKQAKAAQEWITALDASVPRPAHLVPEDERVK